MKTRAALLALCTACSPSSETSTKPAKTPTATKADAKFERADPPAKADTKTDEPPVAVAPPEPEPTEEPAPVDETQLASVAKSINAFSFDLYRQLPAGANTIVSPASVAIALGMTHLGAKGTTQDELTKVLHVDASGLSPEQWHTGTGNLLAHWNGLKDRERPEYMPELKLSVANRLFGDSGTSFHKAYQLQTAKHYRAPLEMVDFRESHEDARKRINTWVQEQTFDRIKDLVPAGGVTPATRIVLVNAVYFKAQWMDTFPEGLTSPQPFFVDGKKASKVDTMSRTGYMRYGKVAGDGLAVLELPYENSPFAMDVVIPDDKDGLAEVEAKLDPGHVDAWLAASSSARVELKLPKFKIEPPDAIRLGRVLVAMGLATAFSDAADFTGMAPKEELIQLAEAFHKAFIEVNEKGTEAAAATAIVGRAGSAMPTDDPIEVNVDRPFLFMVRDTQSGAILFMGRVTNPGG